MSLTFLISMLQGPLQGAISLTSSLCTSLEVLVLSHLLNEDCSPHPASHSPFYLCTYNMYLVWIRWTLLHTVSRAWKERCDSTTCLQVGMLGYLVNCTSAHHDLSLAARCFVCLSLFRTDTLSFLQLRQPSKDPPSPIPNIGAACIYHIKMYMAFLDPLTSKLKRDV